MQPSVELLKELPVNKTEENKSPHALPTLPRISLSSLFSSIFFLAILHFQSPISDFQLSFCLPLHPVCVKTVL